MAPRASDAGALIEAATAELGDAGFATLSTPRVHENIQWMFVRHPEGPGIELVSIR